jgi:GNAT superfamily N-acetyltransferase
VIAGQIKMAAYRFCRTDDIGLLVDALNRCWSPYAPDEPPMTPAAFKRSIRDLQVWCSSCMVAFSGDEPIGVLIGAKRPTGTLVHTIAVHPDHRRQGHGRHLLDSLSSKLAILGPPRISAEVPDTLDAACELFTASGYAQEAVLTDYVLTTEAHADRDRDNGDKSDRGDERHDCNGHFMIPVTVDDLAANGLLGAAESPVCWSRSPERLIASKDDIAGLAIATDERIEAYLLYMNRQNAEGRRATTADTAIAADAADVELVSLCSFVADGGAGLLQLISRLRTGGMRTVWFPKVHPAEMSKQRLDTLGFRPTGSHLLYAAKAHA